MAGMVLNNIGDTVVAQKDLRDKKKKRKQVTEAATRKGLDPSAELSRKARFLTWSWTYGLALWFHEEARCDSAALLGDWDDIDTIISHATRDQARRWRLLGLTEAPTPNPDGTLPKVPSYVEPDE